MRFKSSENLQSRLGETRIVRKFLLLPRTFKSNNTRWLEYADIVERVTEDFPEEGYNTNVWREVGFADEPDSIYPPPL